MSDTLQLTVMNETKQYPRGTRFLDLARQYQSFYEDDIVLMVMGNQLRELRKEILEDGKIEVVTVKDVAGRNTYRRSVALLMQRAYHNLFPLLDIEVQNSFGQGLYCKLRNDEKPTKELLDNLLDEMKKIVVEDWPIVKKSLHTDEAKELFGSFGMKDKERLFKYRLNSSVNVYSIGNYVDYYYGYMVPSTGYLKVFDLVLYDDGFVLMFPGDDSKTCAPFEPSEKFFQILKSSSEWGTQMGIPNIGALNDEIAKGHMQDIILVQEAFMERRIGEIAADIATNNHVKFIMIAGPSSSGKTSFSHRLSIQLITQGLHPYPIPLDNYYLDRQFTPRDEEGNFDFECLEAIDVALFNQDMQALINGDEVELPMFNFMTGKREYHGNKMKLGPSDVLVIEGIHGLNDKLSYCLKKENKYKIYISALTQLNIDEHNSLHTTDGRLLRRIARDARTRNTTAQETMKMWKSVRRGEEKYIFPFQEQADAMFNSAFIYEMAVIKPYVEPLLYQIDATAPEYVEAKRLLKLLSYVLPFPSEDINRNSIFREFIGGSCFHV